MQKRSKRNLVFAENHWERFICVKKASKKTWTKLPRALLSHQVHSLSLVFIHRQQTERSGTSNLELGTWNTFLHVSTAASQFSRRIVHPKISSGISFAKVRHRILWFEIWTCGERPPPCNSKYSSCSRE